MENTNVAASMGPKDLMTKFMETQLSDVHYVEGLGFDRLRTQVSDRGTIKATKEALEEVYALCMALPTQAGGPGREKISVRAYLETYRICLYPDQTFALSTSMDDRIRVMAESVMKKFHTLAGLVTEDGRIPLNDPVVKDAAFMFPHELVEYSKLFKSWNVVRISSVYLNFLVTRLDIADMITLAGESHVLDSKATAKIAELESEIERMYKAHKSMGGEKASWELDMYTAQYLEEVALLRLERSVAHGHYAAWLERTTFVPTTCTSEELEKIKDELRTMQSNLRTAHVNSSEHSEALDNSITLRQKIADAIGMDGLRRFDLLECP